MLYKFLLSITISVQMMKVVINNSKSSSNLSKNKQN